MALPNRLQVSEFKLLSIKSAGKDTTKTSSWQAKQKKEWASSSCFPVRFTSEVRTLGRKRTKREKLYQDWRLHNIPTFFFFCFVVSGKKPNFATCLMILLIFNCSTMERWYNTVESAEWKNLSDTRACFPSVDYVGNQHPVFNIGGNRYRLVVVVKFTIGYICIRFIGTHSEYDKIDCSTIYY